jgi:Holliday junction resolvase-like predicted endonuclease
VISLLCYNKSNYDVTHITVKTLKEEEEEKYVLSINDINKKKIIQAYNVYMNSMP